MIQPGELRNSRDLGHSWGLATDSHTSKDQAERLDPSASLHQLIEFLLMLFDFASVSASAKNYTLRRLLWKLEGDSV